MPRTQWRTKGGILLPKEKQLHFFEKKYKSSFGKQLRDGLRKDGKSIPEVCALWGIAPKTYGDWVNKYPDFAYSAEIGARDAASWWYQLTRAAASGIGMDGEPLKAKANAGIINFALKNIEGINWADKLDVHKTADEEVKRIVIEMLPGREAVTLEHENNVVPLLVSKEIDAAD